MSGWLGRRGDVGLLPRYDEADHTTLEAFDASGASKGVVGPFPGNMFQPRMVELGGRPFAIAGTIVRGTGGQDAGAPPGSQLVTASVAAHALDGTPEVRPLMQGPDAAVLGATPAGDLVVRAARRLRLLTPK